jgi:hypothetical protein
MELLLLSRGKQYVKTHLNFNCKEGNSVPMLPNSVPWIKYEEMAHAGSYMNFYKVRISYAWHVHNLDLRKFENTYA